MNGKASIPTDDLIPLVRRCRNDHSMAYLVPIANTDIYKCSFPAPRPRPLGTGMHFQTLLSPLLKVPRMVLLSSRLWWELGTNLPGPGPGKWLSFWRVTSNNSDSEKNERGMCVLRSTGEVPGLCWTLHKCIYPSVIYYYREEIKPGTNAQDPGPNSGTNFLSALYWYLTYMYRAEMCAVLTMSSKFQFMSTLALQIPIVLPFANPERCHRKWTCKKLWNVLKMY